MNLYEEIIYELYVKSFESSWEKDILLEISLWGFLVSSVVYLASFIFISINKYLFLILYFGSGIFFCVFVLLLLLWFGIYMRKYKKNGINEIRRGRLVKIQNFNLLLMSYGYKSECQILGILKPLRENYLYRKKEVEKKQNTFFKIYFTIFLALVIFFGKEIWETLKSKIADSQYLHSLIIIESSVATITLIILIMFFINRKYYIKDKEEYLIRALEEVILYKQKDNKLIEYIS